MHHDPGDRPAGRKSRQQTPAGSASPLDAVRQLMSERARFEKWLTDLEAKRESTPTHVYDRVRGDYSGRLQAVLDKLRTHTASLQQHASGLSKKLEKLTESERGILDLRAESELRAQVGELSQPEWDKTSKKLEKDLAKLKQDQSLIAADLDNLRDLLGTFDSPGAAPSASAEPPAPASPDAAPAEGNVDELAFLKSVIGTTPTGAQPAPPVAAEPAPISMSKETPRTQPAQPASEAPPAASAPVEKLVETPPPGPVIKAKAGKNPLSANVTGSSPIVLRTSGVVEQPKTLKCGECGSMNYPSEWYCERCGAELVNV